jgi:hypothetical protein
VEDEWIFFTYPLEVLGVKDDSDIALNHRWIFKTRYRRISSNKFDLTKTPEPVLRIRIRDPGLGAFLTPGSGIRNRFIPDPGSRIPDPKLIFLRA